MAGYMWSQVLDTSKLLLNSEKWGWRCVEGVYLPMWSELLNASGFIKELFRRGLNPERNVVANVDVEKMI